MLLAAVTMLGLAAGAAGAWALSTMLVKVLTGVFDPPLARLAVPWPYLLTVLIIAGIATALAAVGAIRSAVVPRMELLRTQ